MELTSNFEKHMNKSNDKRRVPLLFDIKQPPKIDLPKKYLEMIVKELVSAKLLIGVSGKGGGYVLLRPMKGIFDDAD